MVSLRIGTTLKEYSMYQFPLRSVVLQMTDNLLCHRHKSMARPFQSASCKIKKPKSEKLSYNLKYVQRISIIMLKHHFRKKMLKQNLKQTTKM